MSRLFCMTLCIGAKGGGAMCASPSPMLRPPENIASPALPRPLQDADNPLKFINYFYRNNGPAFASMEPVADPPCFWRRFLT